MTDIMPKSNPKSPHNTLKRIEQKGTSTVTGKLRQTTAYFRHRVYSLVPTQLRWLLPFIGEDIKDWFRPETEAEPAPTATVEEKVGDDFSVTLFAPYQKYRCRTGNPLNCEQPQQTVEQDATACSQCGFPAILPNGKEIQGKQGRYRITKYLGSRGLGRLYTAEPIGEARTALIKEYLLPKKHFNEQEAITTQKTFESVGSIELADGRRQTARIIAATEAIADRLDPERCYCVTRDGTGSYPTLRQHLSRSGAMNSHQVRHVLNQALQSLEYLHGQKFRLPSGQIQTGIAHGNLSLDSLLISPPGQPFFHDPQFQIYLCDLALWEGLFTPPPRAALNPTPIHDLQALGYISFYLLAGGAKNRDGYPLTPQVNQHWPKVNIALKLFLFRLLALDTPFASATEARQALLRLPAEEEAFGETTDKLPATADLQKPKQSRVWWLLALLALSVFTIALAGWLSRRQAAIAKSGEIPICCIAQVPAVPAGEFTFTAEQQGLWNYIWRQPNLIRKDQTLEAEFASRRTELQLNYQPVPVAEDAIAQVQSEDVDFAISSLTENLSNALDSQIFAYDGLVVFVAFSYEQREFALPHYLNGNITFKQLRQLYTGQITNWKQLGGPDLPVRLYVPASSEALRIFEQRVLRDEQTITQFRKLIQSETRSENSWVRLPQSSPKIIQLPTIPTLRTVLQDFENEQVGAIGFGPLSQVFGQCSVYPLALSDGSSTPIQPLIQDNGQPINPATDLCNQKGGYFPNFQAFQTGNYPLAYPLAVVYRRDNRRPPIGKGFVNILKTQESQKLLGKTGIVPVENENR